MGAVVYLPRPVLSPELRARCEQTIEWLVALLDAVDTPGADVEPTLGAAEFLASSGCNWKRSREDADECEPDDDGEETLGWSAGMKQLDLGPNTADADNTAPERHGNGFVRCAADDMEPSLGAPELLPGDFYVSHGRCFDIPADQTAWAWGTRDDREGDLADTADDREDDPSELEPSLGAPETTCSGIPRSTDSQDYTWSLLGGVNGGQDYEYDPAESGIADVDGLNEQLSCSAVGAA